MSVSVTALAATYLVNTKVRQYPVSCKLLKICIVLTSLKTFVREIWHHLPVTMIGDSAVSRPKTHQSFLTRLGHYNKIHSFPFHQEVWGMRAGGSLFIIH